MGGGPMGRGPGGRRQMGPKEKIKNPKVTIKRLLSYLTTQKTILILVFILCLIATLITVITTRLYGDVIDQYIIPGNLNGLKQISILLIGLHLINIIAVYFQNLIMLKMAQTTTKTLREDLFLSIQRLPIKFFDTNSSGDIMSRLTNDVDNINSTLSQSITQFFSGIIMIIGMFVAMLLLNPLLTFIGLLTTPLMYFNSRYLVKKTQPFFVKQQRDLGALNGYIEETISGQKAVLLFSQEEKVKEGFIKINRQLTKSALMAQALSGTMGPINNFINNITFLIIAIAGGIFILLGWDLSIGVLFTFILFMRKFVRPINELLSLFNTIQSALVGAERVFEVMDEEAERDHQDAIEMDEIKGEILFKNVDFSYDEKKTVLKNATIKAHSGEVIAIVGPTGAGKTTIINLLTKFYEINQGEIFIDQKNINQFTHKSLRQNISMVLQDTYLFSESVRENIRYGRLNALDNEVIEAAKLANAHHFIMQLPQGYDTILIDNGSNLSLGQRQLLAIARAILSNASILILDEATSSIDTRTEVAIQKAMLHLMEGKTTFVIAHRLSTIRNADQIIVLDQGEIIEQGTHHQLLEADGFYATLYNSQFK